MTGSQEVITHKYLIFRHLRTDKINVCQKYVKMSVKYPKIKSDNKKRFYIVFNSNGKRYRLLKTLPKLKIINIIVASYRLLTYCLSGDNATISLRSTALTRQHLVV